MNAPRFSLANTAQNHRDSLDISHFLHGSSPFATLQLSIPMRKRRSRSSRTNKTTQKPAAIQLVPIMGLPEFRAGDDVAGTIAEAVRSRHIAFENGDVLVVAQKIYFQGGGSYRGLVHDPSVAGRARSRCET